MSVKYVIILLFALLVLLFSELVIADEYRLQRQQMIADIEDGLSTTAKYINKKSFNTDVMRAMAEIPRHEFVPQDIRFRAYENLPLPIGYGQTISQPYIVALSDKII